MDREQIRSKMSDIVESVLRHRKFELKDETTAGEIDGWDSLSHMVIISEIEKAMNMKFAFIEIVNMECMGDMIDLIISKQ